MLYVSSITRFICSGAGLFLLQATFLVELSKAQTQAPGLCAMVFAPQIFERKPDRLYDHYLNETQYLDLSQVQNLNREFLTTLEGYQPPTHERRARGITEDDAYRMLYAARNHSVVGGHQVRKYSQPGESMGYCFGRAMYLHILALKLGVQKASIHKIWALGPMQSNDGLVTWGYHVSLIVFSPQKGWLVLDPNFHRPFSVSEWMDFYGKQSADQRIRFYVTEPEKLGLYAGKYSRYMLGLDLKNSEDWFKHYFVDMLKATRNESLESMGLSKISTARMIKATTVPVAAVEEVPILAPTMMDRIRNFFF